MHPDEVEHRADALSLGLPESPSKLLKEESRAIGRSQEQEGVDARHVDALVEEIDRKDNANAALGEILEGSDALVARAGSGQGDGREAKFCEPLGHEVGVS